MNILQAINESLPELQNFILELKKSYFTPFGKPNAEWNPLKPKTISIKEAKGYSKPTAMNYATGQLRDSCKVKIEFINSQIKITCSFDAMDDEILDTLRFKYGRDFLTFTDDEKLLIIKKATELIKKNL